MIKKLVVLFLVIFAAGMLSSCAKKNVKNTAIVKPKAPNVECDCKTVESPPVQLPELSKSAPVTGTKSTEAAAKVADYSLLKPAKWEEVDGLSQDSLSLAWPAWMQTVSYTHLTLPTKA